MLKNKKSIAWRFEALSFLAIGLIISGAWIGLQVVGSGTESITRNSLNTEVLATKQQLPPAPLTLNEELEPVWNIINNSKQDTYSIQVTDLASGQISGINQDVPLKAASLYKLFVANEALKMVDNNILNLNQMVDSFRELKLNDCIEIMITVSDNDCGVILQRMIGATYSTLPELEAQGFTNTDLRGVYPTTTASDVSKLLQSLHEQAYLSETANSSLIQALKDQTIDQRIPANLPDDILVAHKTADLEGYIHDAGIVYADDRPYALTIMSQPQDQHYKETYADIAEISAAIFEALTSN